MPKMQRVLEEESGEGITLDEFKRLYNQGKRLELARRFAAEVGIISESGGSVESVPIGELEARINKWFDFATTTLVEQQLVNQLGTTFKEFEIRGTVLKFWALCYVAMGDWIPNEQALQILALADHEDGEDELGAVQRAIRDGISKAKGNFNSTKERLSNGESVGLFEEIEKAGFLSDTISLINQVVSEAKPLANELD